MLLINVREPRGCRFNRFIPDALESLILKIRLNLWNELLSMFQNKGIAKNEYEIPRFLWYFDDEAWGTTNPYLRMILANALMLR